MKYILAHENVGRDEKSVNMYVKNALKSSVANGGLKQVKDHFKSFDFLITFSSDYIKRLFLYFLIFCYIN